MLTGRVMAVSLFSVSSRPQGLPSSVQDVRIRARLVDDIDKSMSKHLSRLLSKDKSLLSLNPRLTLC
jgi:hypothetical protein